MKKLNNKKHKVKINKQTKELTKNWRFYIVSWLKFYKVMIVMDWMT